MLCTDLLLLLALLCTASPGFAIPFPLLEQLVIRRGNERKQERHSGRFLHLTDIHLDPLYRTGADPYELCHHFSPNPKLNRAGDFGMPNSLCDTPFMHSNATFAWMRKQFSDVDFIVYTGDSVRHNRDLQIPRTVQHVIEGNSLVIDYFRRHFDLQKTKLIPTIGNNDVFEHDHLGPGPNDFFRMLRRVWAPLGLNLTQDFDIGGYFRQDVKPGLTVLSLNSMYMYSSNEQVGDCDRLSSPGARMLRWMEHQLERARTDGRKVYLMQHVPPLDEKGKPAYHPGCLDIYTMLLGKFADVIGGHFTGHTNEDTLTFLVRNDGGYKLFTLVRKSQPEPEFVEKDVLLVLNNAPSVVPIHNSAVREYTYFTGSENFGTLQDYVQYYANATRANSLGQLQWKVEYVASKVYNMQALDVHNWTNLLKRLSQPGSEIWPLYCMYQTVSAGHGA